MSTRVAWFTLPLALLLSSPEQESEYLDMSKETLFVNCYMGSINESGRFTDLRTGSRYGRSDLLVAPNRRLRAYTEAEAIVEPSGDCRNTSGLFIGGIEGDQFKRALTLEPIDRQKGNGIRAVDWSHDSRFLLLEWQRWYYASEYESNQIMVFDTQEQDFINPDVIEVFQGYGEESCAVLVVAMGFTPKNEIVLRAIPEDPAYWDISCVNETSIWLLDPWKDTLKQLPDEFKPHKYGRIKEQPLPE